VIAAESGASALDAYVSSPAAIDAVVSDISMPGMDGYELIRQIRRVEQGRHQRGVTAIALTAYARDDDRERALAEGFRLHVAKPVDPDRLVRVVAEVTGRVSGS
jgi:CheY-like chemotaxis protein